MAASTRIPSATYRLQLSKDFRFADACAILDYLKDLGISDIYASPILRSRRGSGHGYDATDPTRIDPDLGTEEDFARFQNELHKRGMGLLLDIVPNHMAASDENPWWMDVLEHGPESAYAPYFDINWHPIDRNLDRKILLPFLGRPFGETLDSGELKLEFQDGSFFVRYYDSSFPVAPRSYRHLLEDRTDSWKKSTAENSGFFSEYSGILWRLSLTRKMRLPLRMQSPIEGCNLKPSGSGCEIWQVPTTSFAILLGAMLLTSMGNPETPRASLH